MKAILVHPYGDDKLSKICCKVLNIRNAAIAAGAYTFNVSILITILYCWRIGENAKQPTHLADVYYGVQIAYVAIIGTQMFMIALSILLVVGIFKENTSYIIPWVVGFITFMSLEAVAMVYSNVLRDHVNREFDIICRTEVVFFITRTVVNVSAIVAVLRFRDLLRAGVTWKGPEVIEL